MSNNKLKMLGNCRFAIATMLFMLLGFNALNAQTYCVSKGNLPWTEWIAGVKFGTINSSTSKEGYGDFTSQTTNLTRGTSYPLSITQGFSYAPDAANAPQQGKVWIDYNKNGTFEATELVASFTRTTTTANVGIPTTALLGATRMRVSLKTTGAPTACEVFDKGEVEDYTVQISGGNNGGNLPDLVISSANGNISTDINSSVFNGDLCVNNNSPVQLPSTTAIYTGYYLSADSVLSTDDALIYVMQPVPNGVVCAYYNSVSLQQIRGTTSQGTYYMIAKVDYLNSIVESNETNNTFVIGTITLTPDLTLVNLTIPTPSVEIGKILSFGYTMRSIGTAAVNSPFRVTQFLSTDNVLSANDVSMGGNDIANLPIGAQTISTAAQIPVSLTTGQYFLILKIDGNNQISESNEDNNVLVSPAKITINPNVNNACRYQDSLQLVSLYNATNGANWTNKWNLATPINTWFGVKLSPSGCVQSLDLTDNNLVGAIQNLSFSEIIELQLSVNKLTGLVPNFANCTKLRILSLSNNLLSGSIPNFSTLNLSELYLNNNQLNGTIPTFGFTNLTIFAANNNQLSGSIPTINYPNLVAFDVRNNLLTGSIPDFNSPNINSIVLSSNRLSGCIPASLKKYCGKNVEFNVNPSLTNQNFASFCNNNTGACSSGGNSLVLGVGAFPPSYRIYTPLTFKFTATNSGTTALKDVEIKFTRPSQTVNGGTKTVSIGTFQDFCSGGIECSLWKIPNLPAGATATLDAPVFVLAPTGNITATVNSTSSNEVGMNVSPATTPAQAPTSQALAFKVPTQLIPVIIQRISPNPTEGDVQIKLDSWTKQTVDFNFSDITGKVIYSEKRDVEKGVNRVNFEVFDLPQGVYFIQTNVGKGKDVPTKFVKM
jgi:hypothetical protein